MGENKELINAWEFVEHTDTSIFLTGKAGTGKTTFLRTLKEQSYKRIIVVAPTGVAAINARGVTIHSFFQLSLSPFVPEMEIKSRFDYSQEKKKIIKTLDLLIIDEISMVRADVLDAIDSVMRRFREHDKPFGGVQLLMIGDLQQLTPVVTPGDEQILKKYYDTPYFFSSKALASIDYVTIELQKVYRQQDEEFIRLLNNVREGKLSAADTALLNSRVNPKFRPDATSDYILLTTHNRMADSYNENRLNSIESSSFTFTAETEGVFPDTNFPVDASLTLKKGAQVMFVRNDSNGLYYNGKIGHITFINKEAIYVRCPKEDHDIEVKPETWENTKYTLNEKTKQIEPEVLGTFKQYPLRLAWAITIHKSQGLTFEHATIDASKSFAAGQVYVALSRCKSLEGLVLTSPITIENIINNHDIDNYIAEQVSITQEKVGQIDRLKKEYYRTLLLELFSFKELIENEQKLHRVLTEYFYKEQALNVLHQTCIAELQAKVIVVSTKWQEVIRRSAYTLLCGDAFMERIKKSAAYFYQALTEIFATLLGQTKQVKTNNKLTAKRFLTAFTDLEQSLKAKALLLAGMSKEGFSIPFYLQAKQEAILISMGQDVKAARKKKEKEEKKPKEPKIPTAEISFSLFQSGISVEEIARERGLTTGTIISHLAKYVRAGSLPISRLLPQEKIDAIRKAMNKADGQGGYTAIKALCPASITFDDIRIVYTAEEKKN